jgi:hypothetical protein
LPDFRRTNNTWVRPEAEAAPTESDE